MFLSLHKMRHSESDYFTKMSSTKQLIKNVLLQRTQLLLLLNKKHISTKIYIFQKCRKSCKHFVQTMFFGHFAHISIWLPFILFNCIVIDLLVLGFMFFTEFIKCFVASWISLVNSKNKMWGFYNSRDYRQFTIDTIYNPNHWAACKKVEQYQECRYVVSLQQQQCDMEKTVVSVLWSVIVRE